MSQPPFNYNFPPNFMFPNQPQNHNGQQPENSQNMGIPNNFQMPYMMPPNFGMQYPYNFPYMQFGQQAGGSNLQGSQSTPHLSSGSTDLPDFSTQISLENFNDDTPHSFMEPPSQPTKSTSNYATWNSEHNKALLGGYFHFSNDSELGRGQKGNTFWGKIAAYVNERSPNGPWRSPEKCQSHYRDINKRISVWVGLYRKAKSERRSGFVEDDYITRSQELHMEITKKKFGLLQEWMMVRNQPKYMLGSTTSGSSGSKRKSSEGDDFSSSTLARPEGREATKKKSKGSSSKKKSNLNADEEYSKLTSECDELRDLKEKQFQMMQEVAAAQKETNQNRKMELWYNLNQRKLDLDEYEKKMWLQLRMELFGS